MWRTRASAAVRPGLRGQLFYRLLQLAGAEGCRAPNPSCDSPAAQRSQCTTDPKTFARFEDSIPSMLQEISQLVFEAFS